MKNKKNNVSVEQEKERIKEILKDMDNKGFPVKMYIKRSKRVQGQYVMVIELRHFDADIDSYLNDFRQELKAFKEDTIQVPVAAEAYPLEAMSRLPEENEAKHTIEAHAHDANPNVRTEDMTDSMSFNIGGKVPLLSYFAGKHKPSKSKKSNKSKPIRKIIGKTKKVRKTRT